jgi:hypothetical protein
MTDSQNASYGYTCVYPCANLRNMANKDAGMRVRVEIELREAFTQACRAQGSAASDVIRDFMRGFIEKHQRGQKSLFVDEKTRKSHRFGGSKNA